MADQIELDKRAAEIERVCGDVVDDPQLLAYHELKLEEEREEYGGFGAPPKKLVPFKNECYLAEREGPEVFLGDDDMGEEE